jgi:hypothetical protein
MGANDPAHDTAAEMQDLVRRVARDMALLERAAGHLRGLAWFAMLWLALGMLTVLMVVPRIGWRVLRPEIVIVAVSLCIVAGLYFVLARGVQRGRRWALVLAFLVIGFWIALFAVELTVDFLLNRRPPLGEVVISTIYMIAHLNLSKLLVQSWGAPTRLRMLTQLAADGPQPNDHGRERV